MWENLKGFFGNYKMTAIKLGIALVFVFLAVQYNSYGKRSTAHYVFLQVKNGIIRDICVTPSKNIVSDLVEGTYAIVKDQQIKIEDSWASLVPRDNLYIVIVRDENRYKRRVYEIDEINARLLLEIKDKKEVAEGCRTFHHINRKPVF